MEFVGGAAIAAYAGLWGLVHSLLASDRAKAIARRVFGGGADRWYRLVYNALALLTLAPIVPMMSWFPDRVLYSLPDPWRYVVLFGAVAAGVAALYAISLTGFWDLAGLRQMGLAPKQTQAGQSRLVTSGVYGWVRHPLYLFALGLFWFAPRITVHEFALSLVFTIYMYVGTFFEERRLVDEFGTAYLEYRQRVPRLLPVRWLRGHKEERRLEGERRWESN